MASVTKAVPRPANPNKVATSPHTSSGAPQGPMRWLVLQGDVLDIVVQEEQPDLATKPGERLKRILMGTRDAAAFDAKLPFYQARARGVAGRGEAR